MLSTHGIDFQELTEAAFIVEIEDILENMGDIIWDEVLVEITAEQTKNLKNIDDVFLKMKAAFKSKNEVKTKLLQESKKQLIEQVKKFTGVSNISLIVDPQIGFNAMVAPAYNKALSYKLLELKRDWPDNLHDFAKKYIAGFHLFLGPELIKTLEPREMTSVLLHEFGHVFGHTRAISFIFIHFANMWHKFNVIASIVTVGLVPILPFLFIASRSIEFVNHREEYNSDNFATHYGYGSEMMSTFKKFHGKANSKKQNILIRIIGKILRLMTWLVLPSSHPDNSKRICRLYKEISNDYKDLYPKLGKEVLKTATEFECDPKTLDKKMAQQVENNKDEESTIKKLKDMFLAKRNKG